MAEDRDCTLLGVVHCSASRPSTDYDIVMANRDHYRRGIMSKRGLSGYHGLITRAGVLQLGREPLEIGAHALGHNPVSVSVCLAGGVAEDGKTPEDNFTPDQWDTLKVVVDYWLKLWPHLIIAGHRDLGAQKACPSFDAHAWLRTYYGEVFAAANAVLLTTYMRDYRKERDK